MSKYSHGPWYSEPTIDFDDKQAFCISHSSVGTTYVATTCPEEDFETQKANAQLMSAAPDMYEALMELLLVVHDLEPAPGCKWDNPQLGLAISRCRKALSKVEEAL